MLILILMKKQLTSWRQHQQIFVNLKKFENYGFLPVILAVNLCVTFVDTFPTFWSPFPEFLTWNSVGLEFSDFWREKRGRWVSSLTIFLWFDIVYSVFSLFYRLTSRAALIKHCFVEIGHFWVRDVRDRGFFRFRWIFQTSHTSCLAGYRFYLLS